ncbi:phage tail protein [Acutalibacter intestini]|uniref:phage tail protein n=1 Tax=Acutalibacter intestini TaxID=3093659 RepID=UPI002AC9B18B|nr:phage tail protein [Acutalibacter sp. M00204]
MIEITNKQIERVNLILSAVPGGAEKALSSVIKRATSTVKTKSTKAVSEVYAISQKDIRAESNITVKTQMADGGVVGTVRYAGHAIPLYRFNVSPKRPAYHEQVTAAVKRNSTPTALIHAFTAQMKSGHIGIFERDTRPRLPVSEKYGPSVPGMAGNLEIVEQVEEAAQETIEKRLEHEIERILNGYGK